ncbi:hypothetical protein [Pseudobacillus sp. 179-B 2D1 NHS]|uniref:hypothetical protein n=1 Tax=Pseudobacillus sp. 179-B 2D1 NHS TaxID=3374292 RepID=UPI003879D72E
MTNRKNNQQMNEIDGYIHKHELISTEIDELSDQLTESKQSSFLEEAIIFGCPLEIESAVILQNS